MFQHTTHYTSRIRLPRLVLFFFLFFLLTQFAYHGRAPAAAGAPPPVRPGEIGPHHARNVALNNDTGNPITPSPVQGEGFQRELHSSRSGKHWSG
ncbi:hypothetical protein ACN38_g1754 [Penicillium nordicum]|uniref:Uncharacterized protein n=1 Tax=Penicillium nordicum TaxID=229535 RepID=A0A0M8P8E1_9EURO|nr:hypothetical protein ACN38_g1754 [Penicillium nordicum]